MCFSNGNTAGKGGTEVLGRMTEGLRRQEEGELERHLEGGFAWENPLLEALILD